MHRYIFLLPGILLLAACQLNAPADSEDQTSSAESMVGVSADDQAAMDIPSEASLDVALPYQGRVTTFSTVGASVPAGADARLPVVSGPGAVVYGVDAQGQPLLAGVVFDAGTLTLDLSSTAQAMIHGEILRLGAPGGVSAGQIRARSQAAPTHPRFPHMTAYLDTLATRGQVPILDERAQQMATWVAEQVLASSVH